MAQLWPAPAWPCRSMGHAGPSGSLGQTMLSQYRVIILEQSSLQSEPMPSHLQCLTNIQEGVFATLQVGNDKEQFVD